MDHVAILRKAKVKKGDNLLGDIIAGTKTLESRWYVNKVSPWNKIKSGETIYFKESGFPITAKATVEKVLQFENITPAIVREIIHKYGKQIAPNVSLEEFYKWGNSQSKKRFCILIFLKNVKKVKPFEIDKTGFGNAAAWLVCEDINDILSHYK